MLEQKTKNNKGEFIKPQNKGKRILMSERNTALALEAIKDLKNSNCKISLSELINEALEIFFKKQFSQSKKAIEKKYFDRKKYLKSLLSLESGQDFDDSLKKLVKKISTSSKKEGLSDLSKG